MDFYSPGDSLQDRNSIYFKANQWPPVIRHVIDYSRHAHRQRASDIDIDIDSWQDVVGNPLALVMWWKRTQGRQDEMIFN